jgi:hypothetical protein
MKYIIPVYTIIHIRFKVFQSRRSSAVGTATIYGLDEKKLGV